MSVRPSSQNKFSESQVDMKSNPIVIQKSYNYRLLNHSANRGESIRVNEEQHTSQIFAVIVDNEDPGRSCNARYGRFQALW